jgi:hypothetical protein
VADAAQGRKVVDDLKAQGVDFIKIQSLIPRDGYQTPPAVVYVAVEMMGPGHLKHHGRGELVVGPSAMRPHLRRAERRLWMS